jgi:hypothetical protein
MGTLLSSALKLAEKGLHVFACRPRGKEPATPNGVKDATVNREVISAWWRSMPEANIGIACGKASGIFVVDIDGIDAEAEIAKLEKMHGELPRTVEAITPRGRHLFYRWPPNGEIRNSASKIAPGVDTRGTNGYIISAPSIGPSGKAYSWSVDSAGSFASAPDWLLTLITMPAPIAPMMPIEGRGLAIAEGARNDTLARIIGHLLARHVDPDLVHSIALALGEACCKPPLSGAEITRIVNSIAGRELRKRLQ